MKMAIEVYKTWHSLTTNSNVLYYSELNSLSLTNLGSKLSVPWIRKKLSGLYLIPSRTTHTGRKTVESKLMLGSTQIIASLTVGGSSCSTVGPPLDFLAGPHSYVECKSSPFDDDIW